MKSRLLLFVVTIFLIGMVLPGCGTKDEAGNPSAASDTDRKPVIIATLFPQYDFARQIAGDNADVILLLPPGVESHSFEPTPSDLIEINESQLFIFTGKYMEPWAQKIIGSIGESDSGPLILDASEGIQLEQSQGNDPEEPFDPHIWTDPVYAKVMVENIRVALSKADPEHADVYEENAAAYQQKLDDLDQSFREIVKNGSRTEIISGSRFAMYYFARRYGLECISAFDSCSAETEPSARAVADLIERIRQDQLPIIYYAEIEDPKIARAISAETGAEMLLLHSCHNVTAEEMKSGVTYLSLMQQNAENLRKGLN